MVRQYWGRALQKPGVIALFTAAGALAGAGAGVYLYGGSVSALVASGVGVLCAAIVYLIVSMFARAFDPGTFVGGKLGAQWGVLIVVILVVVAIPAYSDYKARKMLVAAIADGVTLAGRVDEFYATQKRYPLAAEAPKFGADPVTRGWSVAYDATAVAVVVTLLGEGDFKGKRIVLYREAPASGVNWRCRSDDMENKLLPAQCRSK